MSTLLLLIIYITFIGLGIPDSVFGTAWPAILSLRLPLPPIASGVALFLIGLGNGPVFPNMLYLTPEYFGKESSQSAMSLQMVLSYIGILCAPALFGIIEQNISVSLFPIYLTVLCIIMISGTMLVSSCTDHVGKYGRRTLYQDSGVYDRSKS